MLIKMYQNPYTPGFEVLSKSGYSMDHSSLNTSNYLITHDFPDYAAMFYSPTEHEAITQIKYGNFEQDYSNLREMRQSLNNPQIEFYIPSSFNVADGAGRQDGNQIVPEIVRDKLIDKVHKEALNEIKKAQEQVKGRVVRVEFEDILMLRRKRTLIFEDK